MSKFHFGNIKAYCGCTRDGGRTHDTHDNTVGGDGTTTALYDESLNTSTCIGQYDNETGNGQEHRVAVTFRGRQMFVFKGSIPDDAKKGW